MTQLGDTPGSYDGTWSGSTSQAKAIRFTILRNELTSVAIGISVSLGACTLAAADSDFRATPPAVVAAGAFALSVTLESGVSASTSTSPAPSPRRRPRPALQGFR